MQSNSTLFFKASKLIGGLVIIFWLTACNPNFNPMVKFAPPAASTQTATATQPAATFTPMPSTSTPVPATPTVVGCQEESGRLETREFETDLFPKPILVNLYLPPCFDMNREDPYPVVMLLHGQSYTHEQWLDLNLPQLTDQLISTGQAAPFIVAMPREEYYLQDFLDSKYGTALIQAMLPWLSSEYHACAEAHCRAIGGISRGAAWAALLAFENPGTFYAVGAHSVPNAVFSDYRLFYLLGETASGQIPHLYVDIGTSDRYYAGAVQFVSLLEKYGIDHVWLQNEGAHNNEYWSAHIAEYLSWYAEQIAPTQ